jgi:lysophospholipase L1-like esterase
MRAECLRHVSCCIVTAKDVAVAHCFISLKAILVKTDRTITLLAMKDHDESPNTTSPMSRRHLLQGVISLSALGAVGASAQTVGKTSLRKDGVILFQGDSITDAGRDRKNEVPNTEKGLGKGYAMMAAGELFRAHPKLNLQIHNRGNSGNKIPDLEARWQKDAIDLKPDILSILIGVNDLWHTFAFGNKYKGTIKDYEKGYRALIERTQKEIRGVTLVICEPFTTRASEDFKPLAEYRAVAKKIASDLSLAFVPFQAAFDEAVKAAPAEFWLPDGIHPSPAGHALMVETWRLAAGV